MGNGEQPCQRLPGGFISDRTPSPMRFIRWLVPVLILINCAAPAAFVRAAEGGTAPVVLADVQVRAEAALARADLAAYRGWIKFLRFEAETAAAKAGAGS